MKMTIYPLLKTSKGMQPSESAAAEISFTEGEILIKCPDGALREKITEIFNGPLTVMRPCGDVPRLYSHFFAEVPPGAPEFPGEILFELRKYNLHGVVGKK